MTLIWIQLQKGHLSLVSLKAGNATKKTVTPILTPKSSISPSNLNLQGITIRWEHPKDLLIWKKKEDPIKILRQTIHQQVNFHHI